ncbi:MAG: hypothetical protein KAS53_02755 [Candidatus Cloacimonetes bacterium]|nr:hypothetical protein [Candidatus Cloacimonadota bacterium]
MLSKPVLNFIKKDNSVKKLREYDFHKYTDFNPSSIDNLLCTSFEDYFKVDWKYYEKTLNELSEASYINKRLQINSEVVEENIIAIDTFIKKFQYIAVYKLNWNVPDKVLDNLRKGVSSQFYFILHHEVYGLEPILISPLYFNFFISNFFADIFIVFLKEITLRTDFGNKISENNQIHFHHLPFWVQIFSEMILNNDIHFNNLTKGTIWNGVEKDNKFIWNLTFEDKDITKLIKNEFCFEKYKGLIKDFYHNFKNRKLKIIVNNIKSELALSKDMNLKLTQYANILQDEIEKKVVPKLKDINSINGAGAGWIVKFQGITTVLKSLSGIYYFSKCLKAPGTEFSYRELSEVKFTEGVPKTNEINDIMELLQSIKKRLRETEPEYIEDETGNMVETNPTKNEVEREKLEEKRDSLFKELKSINLKSKDYTDQDKAISGSFSKTCRDAEKHCEKVFPEFYQHIHSFIKRRNGKISYSGDLDWH